MPANEIMAKQRKDSNRGNPKLRTGDNPHGFKKGFDERRNLSGPPPKLTKLQVLEGIVGGKVEPEFEKQLTIKVLRWLCEQTPEELKIIVKRKDLASFVILHANCILDAIKNKDTKVMRDIYDRAYGRPTSKVAFTDPDGNDAAGGVVIYLPDNGRGDVYQTEGNSAPSELNKPEPS